MESTASNILTYGLKPRLLARRRWQRAGLVLSGACAVLYVASYALAYAAREPAANMAFFVYPSLLASRIDEERVYQFFFPVYWIHTRLFGAPRHSLDRPLMIDDSPDCGVLPAD